MARKRISASQRQITELGRSFWAPQVVPMILGDSQLSGTEPRAPGYQPRCQAELSVLPSAGLVCWGRAPFSARRGFSEAWGGSSGWVLTQQEVWPL